MTWSACPRSLALSCGALVVFVCGGCGDPADPSGIAVTVLVPSGQDAPPRTGHAALTASIEYRIDCEVNREPTEEDAVELGGAFERAGAFEGPDGETSVFKGMVDPQPGPCLIQFLTRDDDGEVICTWEQPLAAEDEAPPELYLESPCHDYVHCTTTPLPDSERVPKTTCFSLVGVILSTQTPAASDEVHSIQYALREVNPFLDIEPAERYTGSLPFVGPGATDFGNGLIPTDTWRTAIEEVYAGWHELVLTALDSEGGTVCSVDKRVEIVADAVAHLQVAMPCGGDLGGFP